MTKRSMTKRTRILVGLTGPAALLAIGAMTATGSPAGASAGVISHPRPVAARAATGAPAVTVTFVSDQFQVNKGGFCATATEPCDGNAAAGDFGTIDAAVPSHFTNGGFGNYAPGTPALFETKMALISGTTQANQGLGCQTAGVEGCTGPYYKPPQVQDTFPGNGFTVTNDVYLDPAAATGTAGEIDLDVALNNSAGLFAQDNIFAVCNQGGGTGFSVTFGHNSPGDCSPGSPVITTAGWYRFVWLFTNVGGKVFQTQRVIAENGLATVADSNPQPVIFPGDSSVEPVSNVGGIRYFWYPTLQVAGMPMGNFAIQVGQHGTGHTP